VLFAQLVDDPSSHPDRFPTDEAVTAERKRLHQLIEELVVWENSNNENLLRRVHQEILDSTNGSPPPILDPFAGGGSIPLEAQRLGLEAHASDLNPVAVLINKALIEIPPKFAGMPPVFPGAAETQLGAWPRATGLAEDVRCYGHWMHDEAEKRIGHLYPKAMLPDGSQATVIAWIWARTVTCPNPACGIAMPLVRSWWLGKTRGKEAYVVPIVADNQVFFSISHILGAAPTPEADGTVGRAGARCIGCGAAVDLKYIRAEGKAGRMNVQLMATVAEGKRSRVYLEPSPEQEAASDVPSPPGAPQGELSTHPQYMGAPRYGLSSFADLFTNRQLLALTTLSDLVSEVRERVYADARSLGIPEGARLENGGIGASAYADAVITYLGMAQSKATNVTSSITTWMSDRGAFRETFARQALPMTWDFAESNILGASGGSWNTVLQKEFEVINQLRPGVGSATQADAASCDYTNFLLSTDPPYYDNVPYSDLADYFYVWLRRSLGRTHSRLLGTLLTPKADEIVANTVRHGGKSDARRFFEGRFGRVFERARESAQEGFPIIVYYAFKQVETTSQGQTSTGWETLLESMIRSDWCITATWPVRTEGSGRIRSQRSNALASSIVLALRPRPRDAPLIDRRGFVAALKEQLPQALRDLQQGAIAPVDLPQAAIGPGMAVFSRYSAVLEDDGSGMRVGTALARINEVLDEVLSEQEGDFDPISRFGLAWFRQHGFEPGPFGAADGLARARNASLEHIERAGILTLSRREGTPACPLNAAGELGSGD